MQHSGETPGRVDNRGRGWAFLNYFLADARAALLREQAEARGGHRRKGHPEAGKVIFVDFRGKK